MNLRLVVVATGLVFSAMLLGTGVYQNVVDAPNYMGAPTSLEHARGFYHATNPDGVDDPHRSRHRSERTPIVLTLLFGHGTSLASSPTPWPGPVGAWPDHQALFYAQLCTAPKRFSRLKSIR
jgi:hypothetical protein